MRHKRSSSVVASTLVVSLLAAIVVAVAIRADGYAKTRLNLRDEGVWVIRPTAGGNIGYLNGASWKLDVKFDASFPPSDVTQGEGFIVLSQNDDKNDDKGVVHVEVMEATAARPAGSLERIKGGLRFSAGGTTAALLDPVKGTAFTAPLGEIRNLKTDGKPTAKVGASPALRAVMVVGRDGSTHVFSAQDGTLTTVDPDGRAHDPRRFGNSGIKGPLQISAIGDGAVVLDTRASVLVLPDGDSVQLPPDEYGTNPMLQQPGDDPDVVVVATDTKVVEVDASSGVATTLAEGRHRDPIAPVRDRGYTYAAWNGDSYAERIAPDRSVYKYPDVAGKDLAWRVGNGLVALNDAATGDAWSQKDGQDPLHVTAAEWSTALDRARDTNKGENGRQGDETKTKEIVKEQLPPEAKADAFGTRVGRPVIIPVLDNDRDPNGDVIYVTSVRNVEAGSAGPVAGGTAVQFSPVETGTNDKRGNGSFDYTISDGNGGTADAHVEVTVFPLNAQDNKSPSKKKGEQAVVHVGRQQTFEANLLRGWSDPEGDVFALDAMPGFEPAEAAGWFTAEPDGRLVGRGYAPGKVTISFRVRDEFEGRASGQFVVDVAPEATVQPHDDTVYSRPGESAVADVLANDLGSDLRIGVVKPEGTAMLAYATEGGRKLLVRAEEPGEYAATYQVAPAGAPPSEAKTGRVRVVVPARPGPGKPNTPPVAARDFALTKPGVPAIVDVLHNDSDVDADVMVVTSVTTDVAGVEVAVIENQYVRVQVEDFPLGGGAIIVRYSVSDGLTVSPGMLLVLRDTFPGDRAPVLRDDFYTVRAGQVLRVSPLENDTDSDSVLRMATDDAALQAGAGGGRWSVNGDDVFFVAPPNEGRATAAYRVDGALQTATINITVTRLRNGGNVTLDRLPDVTVRALQGQEIEVRLPLRADPDGDALTVTGTVESSPNPLGTVAKVDDRARDRGVLTYRAEANRQGLDWFTYEVEEQYGDKQRLTGRVWVGIAPAGGVVDAPIAYPDIAYVRPSEVRRIDVLRNDTPAGRVDLVSVQGVSFGRASIDTRDRRAISYTAPPENEARDYTLTYVIGLNGLLSTGSVIVHVLPERPNLAPTVRSATVYLSPRESGSFDALRGAYDADRGPQAMVVEKSLLAEPKNARVSVDSGRTIRIDRPAETTTVVFSVFDGDKRTQGYVRFEVENRPPESSWRAPLVDGEKPQTVDLRKYVSDPEGKTWRLVRTRGAVNGQITSVAGNRVVFTPNADTTRAQFNAEVVDESGKKASLPFDFRVRTNLNPRPAPVSVTVSSRSSRPTVLVIDPNDPDPADRGKHRLRGCTAGAGVSVKTVDALKLEIRASALKGARSTIRCEVVDSREKTGPVVVNVIVGGTDRGRPVAYPIEFEGEQGGVPRTVPVRFEDPLGDGVTIILRGSAPEGAGSVTTNGHTSITVTPPVTDFSGSWTISYLIRDAEEREAESTVKVLVKGQPKAPSEPAVIAGDATVRVSWSPPAPNGVPVHYYEVRAIGPSAPQPQKPSGASATFTRLINGESYRFEVKACHVEWGCSVAVLSPPATPDSPPLAPLVFTATRGSEKVTLTWQAGASGGTAIRGYRIDCAACGASVPKNPGDTSHEWSGLTNGVLYQFSIVAFKTLSSTTVPVESVPISASMIPAGRPFPPVVNAPTRNENGTVTVSWNEANWNGTNEGAAYAVTVVGGSGDCPSPGSGLSTTCDGIAPGAQVHFAVTATNTEGTSTPGESAVIIAAQRPGTANISGFVGQGGTAQLTVSTSNNGGVPVTGYDVERNGQSVGRVSGTTAITVSTESPCANYSFRVKAVNEANFVSSNWSDTVAVRGQGVPTVTSFTGSSGSNTLHWNWSVDLHCAVQVSVNVLDGGNDVGVACNTSQNRRVQVVYRWDNSGADQSVTTGSVAAYAAACPTRNSTIQDDFLGGTWSRTTPTAGLWGSRTSPPANAADWLTNGTTVTITCSVSSASYSVTNNGNAETWTWWARISNGRWVRTAALFIMSSNGAVPGVPQC